jgi:hypothetical protein
MLCIGMTAGILRAESFTSTPQHRKVLRGLFL